MAREDGSARAGCERMRGASSPLFLCFCAVRGQFARQRMTDEQPAETAPSEEPKRRRPSSRSRRGSRGRSRRPAARDATRGAESPPAPAAPPEPVATVPEGEPEVIGEADAPLAEAPLPDSPIEEIRREFADATVDDAERARESGEESEFRPASGTAIGEAIKDVDRILATLREVLDQMEEVLETLELAEVQKNVDEREIENLRRSLRQFGRSEPRSGGGEQREPREHRERRDSRHHRPHRPSERH